MKPRQTWFLLSKSSQSIIFLGWKAESSRYDISIKHPLKISNPSDSKIHIFQPILLVVILYSSFGDVSFLLQISMYINIYLYI